MVLALHPAWSEAGTNRPMMAETQSRSQIRLYRSGKCGRVIGRGTSIRSRSPRQLKSKSTSHLRRRAVLVPLQDPVGVVTPLELAKRLSQFIKIAESQHPLSEDPGGRLGLTDAEAMTAIRKILTEPDFRPKDIARSGPAAAHRCASLEGSRTASDARTDRIWGADATLVSPANPMSNTGTNKHKRGGGTESAAQAKAYTTKGLQGRGGDPRADPPFVLVAISGPTRRLGLLRRRGRPGLRLGP